MVNLWKQPKEAQREKFSLRDDTVCVKNGCHRAELVFFAMRGAGCVRGFVRHARWQGRAGDK